jgi:formamidopyrimidine-DNA glycosylase
MPELPEVETIARGLDKRVAGDRIDSVWLGSKPEILKSPASEIVRTLESKRIVGVRRVGKHIVFDLDGDSVPPKRKKAAGASPASPAKAQWIVHLGMTGRVVVSEAGEEILKHTHAILQLASGRELRFVDPRRFGRLSVAQAFAAPGVEPLQVELERFVKLFKGRKTPIKSALLNQKLLSGVGNIYADESLFRAGIRPRRRAASLTREELRRLYLAVQEVLKEAIALGGSSISDYVDADGEEGFFQLQHRVYGREGEPCLVCKTAVKRVVLGGRSSHYCPKCQK